VADRVSDKRAELESVVVAEEEGLEEAHRTRALKESRFVANAVLLGDRRKFIGALIVPDLGAIENHLASGRRQESPDPAAAQDLLARPEVLRLIQQEVDRVNERLATYEQVRRFVLLDRDLSAEAGELTPTLKVRRRVLLETRREAIQTLYG